MKASIKHDLPPEQLRLAVRKFAEVYVQRFHEYQATSQWLSDDLIEVRFLVKGVKLTGRLELRAHDIGLEMNVPMLFSIFKGRAMRAIEEEVTPWLDKAKRGELG